MPGGWGGYRPGSGRKPNVRLTSEEVGLLLSLVRRSRDAQHLVGRLTTLQQQTQRREERQEARHGRA